MKLFYEHVHSLGCINKTQAQLLGVHWPLVKGWKRDLIGREIDDFSWRQVEAVRGLNPSKRKAVLQGQLPNT